MGPRGIPRDVQRFIADHLTSVAQLEVLLTMHADPGRPRTAQDVAEALRIDPGWAASELDGLRRRGLLREVEEVEGAFCFAPGTDEMAQVVDSLARVFATHRVSVITLIFSKPSDAVSSFADAFKLRRDDRG